MPGSSVGHLAGSVGVERPADGVREPVLVCERAAVISPASFEKPYADVGIGVSCDVLLGRRELRARSRTPSTTTRRRAARPARRARRGRRRCRARCSSRAACAGTCGSSRCRRRSRRGGSRASQSPSASRASVASRRSPVCISQASRIHWGASRWSETTHLPVGVADQALAPRPCRSCRRRRSRGPASLPSPATLVRLKTSPAPVAFHGSTSSGRAAAAVAARSSNSEWFVATITASAP